MGDKQEQGILLNNIQCTYLLLTELEVRTASYGPSFFPSIYGPNPSAGAINRRGKKRGSLSYGTVREGEVTVSKIFIISLLCV